MTKRQGQRRFDIINQIFQKKIIDLESEYQRLKVALYRAPDAASLLTLIKKFDFLVNAARTLSIEVSRQPFSVVNPEMVTRLKMLFDRAVAVQVSAKHYSQLAKVELEKKKRKKAELEQAERHDLEEQDRAHEAYLLEVRAAAKESTYDLLASGLLAGILYSIFTSLDKNMTEEEFVDSAKKDVAEEMDRLDFIKNSKTDFTDIVKEFDREFSYCMHECYSMYKSVDDNGIVKVRSAISIKVENILSNVINKAIFAMMLEHDIESVQEQVLQYTGRYQETCKLAANQQAVLLRG